MRNPSPENRIAEPSPSRDAVVAGLCAAFVLLPELFLSTDPYLAALRFPALALSAILGWRSLAQAAHVPGPAWKTVVAGIFGVHLFSAIGGILSGVPLLQVSRDAAAGLVSIAGLFVVTTVLLRDRWHKPLQGTLTVIAVILSLSSLAAYFLPLDRLIPIGNHPVYYEPTRLPLLWPTRLLAEGFGQLAWEHSNHAGFLFSLVLILGLELLAHAPRRSYLWALVLLMGTCIFLTGSRSAWLMLAAGIPLVLFRRRLPFLLATLGAITAAILLGIALLEARKTLLHTPELAPKAPVAEIDLHTTGLIERGSTGRLSFYPLIWKELDGHHAFGKGLAATGKPVGYLYHEHSIFLASLRGGGITSMAAHLALTAAACWAALLLFSKGCRWPLILLAGVLANCLFDRSHVFKLSGSYEFILYWPAIFIPFLIPPPNKTPGPLPDRVF